MVHRNDLTIYDRHADDWWKSDSAAFRSLHAVNQYRVDLLDLWLKDHQRAGAILDIGCGGGLLSEPMSHRGGRVVGIDLSQRSLEVAARRASSARFLRADARRLPFASGSFSGVLLADVLEHVDGWRAVMAEVSRVTAPGGWVFVNTINRTLRARWLVAGLAEWLRFIPRGTHDPALFIRPIELESTANGVGLEREQLQGETVRLGNTLLSWRLHVRRSSSTALGYSTLMIKTGAGS